MSKETLDEIRELRRDARSGYDYISEMADEGPMAPYCPDFQEREARVRQQIAEIERRIDELLATLPEGVEELPYW